MLPMQTILLKEVSDKSCHFVRNHVDAITDECTFRHDFGISVVLKFIRKIAYGDDHQAVHLVFCRTVSASAARYLATTHNKHHVT